VFLCRNRLHIPSLESVYQAMAIQHDILNKQRVIMADIARRVQEQRSSSQIPLISSAVLARVHDKEAACLDRGYVLYFPCFTVLYGDCLIIQQNLDQLLTDKLTSTLTALRLGNRDIFLTLSFAYLCRLASALFC
jgi:capsular polysaccharide biosynthesis protein